MVSPVVRQQIRRRCNGKAFVYGVLVAAVATGILLLRSHQTNDTFLDGKLLLYNTPAAAADVAAAKNKKKPGHRVAGLVCDSLGGPFSLEATNEMVYWSDIPRDATFQSPFRNTGSNPLQPTSESLPPQQATVAKEEELFFTFEPDEGGWNNIRMAMETAVALAVSMGRTLVLPPKMRLYLLWNGESDDSNVIGFSDLFHVESIQAEHAAAGLKVITFQQFLEQQAMVGHILHPDNSGRPAFPPDNRTDWNGVRQGASHGEGKALWEWVRSVTTPLPWAFEHCVVALAARPGKRAADSMDAYLEQVRLRDKSQHQQKGMSAWRLRVDSYKGHPTPVNASASGRLAELLAHRNRLCVYDEKLQQAKVVHVVGETKTGFRLLIHFYAFLFFEDWKQDLWIKRFIRDHFR